MRAVVRVRRGLRPGFQPPVPHAVVLRVGRVNRVGSVKQGREVGSGIAPPGVSPSRDRLLKRQRRSVIRGPYGRDMSALFRRRRLHSDGIDLSAREPGAPRLAEEPGGSAQSRLEEKFLRDGFVRGSLYLDRPAL